MCVCVCGVCVLDNFNGKIQRVTTWSGNISIKYQEWRSEYHHSNSVECPAVPCQAMCLVTPVEIGCNILIH